MIENSHRPSRVESLVGLGILLMLVVIAAGVYLQQFRYDSAMFRATAMEADAGKASTLGAFLPAGLVAMNDLETFDPVTLADKINGKAETYLPAGFVQLQAQRFRPSERDDVWFEVFVFDMGSASNAYGVYSSQKRCGAEALDVGAEGYRSANGVFFHHGRYYVELVAGALSAELPEAILQAVDAFAQNFAERTAVDEDAEALELSLFPAEGLEAESIALNATNALGFERFDNVFTARYVLDGAEAVAFVSLRATEAEAAELIEAFHALWLQNGARDVSAPAELPEAKMMEIFGMFEVIFARGKVLAGVHEVENRAVAEKLAKRLMYQIAEAGR